MKADLFIMQGDLSKYCINPVDFEVILQRQINEDNL